MMAAIPDEIQEGISNDLSGITFSSEPGICISSSIGGDGGSTKRQKIFIGVPTTVSKGICPELMGFLIAYKKKFDDPNDPLEGMIGINYRNHQSVNNNLLANQFLKDTDCTHYLKIDSDIVPYMGLVERCLELDKPALCFAVAIYRDNIDGAMTCIYNGQKGKYELIDFVKKPVGICDFGGGGVICLTRELLESLKQPFWKLVLNLEDGDVLEASDERFSRLVKKNGYNFWYDATKILGQHHDIIIGGMYDGNCDRRQNMVLKFEKTGKDSIKYSKEGKEK